VNLEIHLRKLEESLLVSEIRHDLQQVEPLIADDFIELGSSGRIFNKASILEELQDEPYRETPILSDFSLRELAPDVVLVTYKTTRSAKSPEKASAAIRSSIWIKREGRWQVTFHQGTRLPDQG